MKAHKHTRRSLYSIIEYEQILLHSTHTHRLNDMKAHKKAMGHGTLTKKHEKKDLAKEIKSMEEVMRC
jgi:hypothetical protein